MTVRETVHGRTLVVHMEREAKRNAVDRAMSERIGSALDRLEDDDDLRVGIITGTNTVFSAGSDLTSGGEAKTERGGEYGVIRRQRRKPLIAAVEGPALGGGFEIVLACDLVVASTTARFALPETRRGVIATSGALFRAMRVLPLPVVKQLLITGFGLSAERAYHFGLVNAITEPGNAMSEALAMAEDICLSSPVAVRETLVALAEQFEVADEKGWAATGRAIDTVMGSDDLKEGVQAFLERRIPEWRGR
ncbi:enoyl-CoA hydratase-related protein [Rhodococcus sp. NPDC003382]|uniref:enoyl-CoA hydratase-related protein n=1 Tax=Rhodococcus sp. HM1 TaxID=2937759 RepID=UPI00200AD0D1|nr:enoyl-CoA hydratase-related protein [Rhodococcus sp. HM1]MCK8669803.1 enoyl-CoA hydratase-related protein [Rhodococcus sp. HM1]